MLGDLLNGREAQFLNKCRRCYGVFCEEIRPGFREFAVLEVFKQKMAGLVQLGEADSSWILLEIAGNETEVSTVLGERERKAARTAAQRRQILQRRCCVIYSLVGQQLYSMGVHQLRRVDGQPDVAELLERVYYAPFQFPVERWIVNLVARDRLPFLLQLATS